MYFGAIIDSHAIIRNKSDSPVIFCLLSPNGTSCKTIAHYHNQNIDINSQDTEHFYLYKDSSCSPFLAIPKTYSHHFYSPTRSHNLFIITILFSILIILSFQEFYKKGIIWYITFWGRLFFLFSTIVQRGTRVFACISSQFLFTAKKYSIVWIYQGLFSIWHNLWSGFLNFTHSSVTWVKAFNFLSNILWSNSKFYGIYLQNISRIYLLLIVINVHPRHSASITIPPPLSAKDFEDIHQILEI